MATYDNFDGLIKENEIVGITEKLITKATNIILSSFVNISSKDAQTLVENIWNFYNRTLTDNTNQIVNKNNKLINEAIIDIQEHREDVESKIDNINQIVNKNNETINLTLSDIKEHRETVEDKIDVSISTRASQDDANKILDDINQHRNVVENKVNNIDQVVNNNTELINKTITDLQEHRNSVEDKIDVPISTRKPNVIDFTNEDRQLLKNISNQVNEIYNIEKGNWIIKDKQMIFYDINGNEIMRFNLLDKNDKPTETSVYKRIRVESNN